MTHSLSVSDSTIPKLYAPIQVAELLGVSLRTVQNHRMNMCRKLGLRGAQALLQFALEHATPP